MNPLPVSTALVESYFGLLNTLSPGEKLDLIARLSASIKEDLTETRPSAFSESFGAWHDTTQTAEALAESIRNSRHFNRTIEPF